MRLDHQQVGVGVNQVDVGVNGSEWTNVDGTEMEWADGSMT